MANDKISRNENTSHGVAGFMWDVFGLGVNGGRTITAMFVNPQSVFQAARDFHWRHRFTPSVRLAFSLVVAAEFFKFFFNRSDSPIYQRFVSGFEAVKDAPSTSPELAAAIDTEFVTTTIDNIYVLQPFAFLVFTLLAALLLRVWGRDTDASMRIRLYFLAIVPGYVALLLANPIFLTNPSVNMEHFWIVLYGGVFALDFATALRGGVAGVSVVGRILRAGLFSTVNALTIQLYGLATLALGTIATLKNISFF